MSVEVHGLDEAIDYVEGVVERAADLSPALAETADAFEAFIAERFATRTAPDGTPWAPTKEESEATGATAASVYAEVRGPDRMAFGARSEAAAFQNDGTKYMPARPFLPSGSFGGPEDVLLDTQTEAIADFIVEE